MQRNIMVKRPAAPDASSGKVADRLRYIGAVQAVDAVDAKYSFLQPVAAQFGGTSSTVAARVALFRLGSSASQCRVARQEAVLLERLLPHDHAQRVAHVAGANRDVREKTQQRANKTIRPGGPGGGPEAGVLCSKKRPGSSSKRVPRARSMCSSTCTPRHKTACKVYRHGASHAHRTWHSAYRTHDTRHDTRHMTGHVASTHLALADKDGQVAERQLAAHADHARTARQALLGHRAPCTRSACKLARAASEGGSSEEGGRRQPVEVEGDHAERRRVWPAALRRRLHDALKDQPHGTLVRRLLVLDER